MEKPRGSYPSVKEIENWVQSIWALADATECQTEVIHLEDTPSRLGVHHYDHEFQFVKLTPPSGLDPFYIYWQPCSDRQAPLLVHVPGYGAEMSTHPEFVSQGFHVLHISPLGYTTPWGRDESKRRNADWPVLPDTVSSGAEGGYRVWLANCLMAVRWAQSLPVVLPDRVSFFGSSQGGGGALLLGSLYQGRGVQCVAADVPFLTNYPLADGRGAYRRAVQGLEESANREEGWKALGYIDTLSHAHRLDIPVLLTSGEADTACPPDTIETLYERLPGTRSITFLKGGVHRYTKEFVALASAWFRLYA
ncbi:acetylxylan esterase [Paenibacillus koleovorans]|uniref:acetylxylan esterase n=1 Tax=Paenibacillus koleovorans TaxID=121608 RepID=UPI000FD939F9|nr:acetylxylan esterase [Paenibacillus koleovorans]